MKKKDSILEISFDRNARYHLWLQWWILGFDLNYFNSYLCNINVRGYIPKFFAFKNPYPLNPEESDLFYFLLIRIKRPKSPKFQKAVSSSSKIPSIQRIPRDTKTLAFLFILCQKVDSRGMRKYLHKVPTVDFLAKYQ